MKKRDSGNQAAPSKKPAGEPKEKTRPSSRLLYEPGDFGRLIPIPSEQLNTEPYRSPWRRDYARVVHCPAFRRQQGKTQLYPGVESDFFRNRLTHSLEVAQIAKSIAAKLNATEAFFRRPGFEISTDLVETLSLVHDIGHPPFGHTGEKALDECMKHKGGFEGNAQTLRVLAKIEKRQKYPGSTFAGVMPSGEDGRVGLNLCFRSLAGVLKYDHEIKLNRKNNDGFEKGYYGSEAKLVKAIKHAVTDKKDYSGPFKTIECQIMDIADDIAYSTYDIEDTFKAKFLTPLSMLGAGRGLKDDVLIRVQRALGSSYTEKQMLHCLYTVFKPVFEVDDNDDEKTPDDLDIALFIAQFSSLESKLMGSGYLRTPFTSDLVGRFVAGVEVEPNEEIPALSKVKLSSNVLETVEVLKNFAFCGLINSPRLKLAEYRGTEIVTKLFNVLSNRDGEGERLLPDDFQSLFADIKESERDRVICDFIAGMTDRYAIEFYGRLTSERPETIFKPH